MPKTVPPSKFQEWKGLDRISLIVHEMNCIFREITKDDLGIDGEIEIVVPKADGQGFQTTGGIIKVQAKSGLSYVKEDNEEHFSTPVSKDDLELWHNATYPTAFIVYHPKDDKLYWKEVKAYVRNTPNIFQPPFKITFDKAQDEFNAQTTFESLSAIAGASPPRIVIGEKERLISNLLKIQRLPRLWSAPTSMRSRGKIFHELGIDPPPFTISNERLYSLGNLQRKGCSLAPYFDNQAVRPENLNKVLEDAEQTRDYVYLLNQLLAIHLQSCGLDYSRDFRRDYFPKGDDDKQEFKRGWYNIRTARNAPERILAKYYEYGVDRFWRHTAVNLSFKLFGNTWYLQIIPKYFFTYDGQTPYNKDKVGPYTTQIKARETNQHVLNHVLFWSDVLSNTPQPTAKETIDIYLESYPVMVIERMPTVGIAEFSIPFDPAIYEEPFVTGQLDFFSLVTGDDDDESGETAEGDDDDEHSY